MSNSKTAISKQINNIKQKSSPANSYVIKDMKQSHFEQILMIANRQLGQNYVTHQLLNDCIKKNTLFHGRTVIDTETKHILGFCISIVINDVALSDMLNMDIEAIPCPLSACDQLGVIKTIAIKHDQKGYGIGTHLILDAIHQLQQYSQMIATIAWKTKYGINLHGVLMKTGFQRLFEIPHFWYQSSLETGCHCAVCGRPPCLCSAVIYIHQTKKVNPLN